MNTKIPVLIGDIGGTNSRLGIFKMSKFQDDTIDKIDRQTLVSFSFDGIFECLESYLKPFRGTPNYPQYAVVGIPAPVFQNGFQKITNIPKWPPETGANLARRLGLAKFVFLNDFVCNGYGVQCKLTEGKDYIVINRKPVDPKGPKAIIGPGTGVGVGMLFKEPKSPYYLVCPSEGSHQDFAPRTELEWKYASYLMNLFGIHHVSVERASCGVSICAMYKFLHEEEKITAEPTLKAKVYGLKNITENDDDMVEVNKEIFQKGLKKECKVCERVINFFLNLLGKAAGNLAITTICTGGMYLLGGISVALADAFKRDPIFMEQFIHKGRFKPVLSEFPVFLITDGEFGMRGAKEYARRLIEGTIGE